MSSGEEFPLYMLTIQCKCCTSFLSWHWLVQLVASLHICKFFSRLSHVFVDKL